MKKIFGVLVLGLVFMAAKAQSVDSLPLGPDSIFVKDYNQAVALSQSTHKPLMIFFCGSDWCKLCIKMKHEVLETAPFAAYAKDHLVIYLADFPYRIKQDKALKESNEKLAEKYNPKGEAPRFYVLNNDGSVKFGLGYLDCKPEEFVNLLKTKL